MISEFRQLLRSKDLLYMLTWRDVRVRYKQSVMGFFWAILMPLLIVSSGILVRIATATYSGSTVSKADLGSVMIRAVAWAFFIAGIRFSTNSLIGNPNLVTKIAFPKEVFPISAVLANLIDLSISLPLVLIVGFVLGCCAAFLNVYRVAQAEERRSRAASREEKS